MKISGFSWPRVTNWAPYRAALGDSVESQPAGGTVSYSELVDVSALPATSAGLRWRGGLNLKDGKVLMLPAHSDVGNFYVFNPSNNQLTVDSNIGAWGGPGEFWGGALLNDGRAVIAPFTHPDIKIYDPVSKIMSSVSTGAGAGGNKFQGAVTLLDGRVLFAPYDFSSVSWLTADGTAFVTGPAHGRGLKAFSGAVLMPSGKVLLVPHQSTHFGIFDPSDNSFALGPAHGKTVVGPAIFGGGLLMPNGKVFVIPARADSGMVFDPVEGTAVNAGALTAHTSEWYLGGAILPDGRVALAPGFQPNISVFDPDSVLISQGASIGALANPPWFTNAVSMVDGRVLLIPARSEFLSAVSLDGHEGGLPAVALQSGYLNRA